MRGGDGVGKGGSSRTEMGETESSSVSSSVRGGGGGGGTYGGGGEGGGEGGRSGGADGGAGGLEGGAEGGVEGGDVGGVEGGGDGGGDGGMDGDGEGGGDGGGLSGGAGGDGGTKGGGGEATCSVPARMKTAESQMSSDTSKMTNSSSLAPLCVLPSQWSSVVCPFSLRCMLSGSASELTNWVLYDLPSQVVLYRSALQARLLMVTVLSAPSESLSSARFSPLSRSSKPSLYWLPAYSMNSSEPK